MPKVHPDFLTEENQEGLIFKNVSTSNMEVFIRALFSTDTDRPYLRVKPSEYTVRLTEEGKYRVFSRSELPEDPNVLPEIGYGPYTRANSYTRPQSTTYCIPGRFVPSYFCFQSEKIHVGFAFPANDVLLRRVLSRDMGTYGKPYNFDSKWRAERYLKEMSSVSTKNDYRYFENLKGLSDNYFLEVNEVMAGFRWDFRGESAVTVFSNDLESRLYAQLVAAVVQRKIKEKMPDLDEGRDEVPISIYPSFRAYTQREQKADIEQASVAGCSSNLAAYPGLISIIKGDFSGVRGDITAARALCKKFFPEEAEKNFLLEKNPDFLKTYDLFLQTNNLSLLKFILNNLVLLTSVLKSYSDKVPPELKDKLPGLVRLVCDANSFELVPLLNLLWGLDLPPDQRAQIWEAAKGKLSKIIRTAYDLELLLKAPYLSDVQRTQILIAVKGELPKLIESVTALKLLLEVSHLSDTQRTQIWDVAKGKLSKLIESAYELKLLLQARHLSDAQRTQILVEVKGELPELIKSVTALTILFEVSYLSDTQRTQIWDALKGKLSELIKSEHELVSLLRVSHLSDVQRTQILDAVKVKLSKLIESGYDLEGLLKVPYLSDDHRIQIWDAAKGKLSKLIKSEDELVSLLSVSHLSDVQRTQILDAVKVKLSKLIQFGFVLSRLLEAPYLSDDHRIQVWDAVKGELSELIRSEYELATLLEVPHLSDTQRTQIWDVVKDRLPKLINSRKGLETLLAVPHLSDAQRAQIFLAYSLIRPLSDEKEKGMLLLMLSTFFLWQVRRAQKDRSSTMQSDLAGLLAAPHFSDQHADILPAVKDKLPESVELPAKSAPLVRKSFFSANAAQTALVLWKSADVSSRPTSDVLFGKEGGHGPMQRLSLFKNPSIKANTLALTGLMDRTFRQMIRRK